MANRLIEIGTEESGFVRVGELSFWGSHLVETAGLQTRNYFLLQLDAEETPVWVLKAIGEGLAGITGYSVQLLSREGFVSYLISHETFEPIRDQVRYINSRVLKIRELLTNSWNNYQAMARREWVEANLMIDESSYQYLLHCIVVRDWDITAGEIAEFAQRHQEFRIFSGMEKTYFVKFPGEKARFLTEQEITDLIASR